MKKAGHWNRAGEVASATQKALRAIHLAKSLGDGDGEAEASAALAYAHIRLGHYPEARRLCLLALEVAGPDTPARAEALLPLGICASESDDIPTAEEYFKQVVDLSRQIGYDRAQMPVTRSLAAEVCARFDGALEVVENVAVCG